MKIGLIDVDGHRFPNLCLMKLSAYHKARGDTVEWHDGRDALVDANLLACPDWERLLRQLADSGAYVDFTQGLDIRLITLEEVDMLNRIRTKMLHFAWDNPEDDLIPYFQQFAEFTSVQDKRKRKVYVLTNYGSTQEQDLYRIYTLRDMGYDPYVMIYEKPTAPPEIRNLQRWVNNKWIFWSVRDFKDYNPKYQKERR